MARPSNEKYRLLQEHFKKPFRDVIRELYENENLSSIEISEKIHNEARISFTSRSVQRYVKALGIGRNKSQARNLAIKKGRMDYGPFRKPIKANEYRKGINLKIRYETLKRDNFRCVLCGQNANEEKLVIDHIIPVVKGGTNHTDNLRVLCRTCNHGKMIYEREK